MYIEWRDRLPFPLTSERNKAKANPWYTRPPIAVSRSVIGRTNLIDIIHATGIWWMLSTQLLARIKCVCSRSEDVSTSCRRSALKFLLYFYTNSALRPGHYSYDALSVSSGLLSAALWRRTAEAPLVGHVEEREIFFREIFLMAPKFSVHFH